MSDCSDQCNYPSNPLFSHVSQALTPVPCSQVEGSPDPCTYCCFQNQPPGGGAPTLPGAPAAAYVTMLRRSFQSSGQTYSDIVLRNVDNACYTGGLCLPQPNLQGNLGNVAVFQMGPGDTSCNGNDLPSIIVDQQGGCPQSGGWEIGSDPKSCDWQSTQGCIPCCQNLQSTLLRCLTTSDGQSYGYFQCKQKAACVSPYSTSDTGDCYLYDPVSVTCDSSGNCTCTTKQNNSTRDSDANGDNPWCWTGDSNIQPGAYYCAGDNSAGGDCSRSITGCWCKNDTGAPINHTNAWAANNWPNPGSPQIGYCPATLKGNTCAELGHPEYCSAGPQC